MVKIAGWEKAAHVPSGTEYSAEFSLPSGMKICSCRLYKNGPSYFVDFEVKIPGVGRRLWGRNFAQQNHAEVWMFEEQRRVSAKYLGG